MYSEAIGNPDEQSLTSLLLDLVVALVLVALERSRATSDPIESGFLPA